MVDPGDEEERARKAAYMRAWRARQKGKPKRKRRRPVGRPRLPASKGALDSEQYVPLAYAFADRYHRLNFKWFGNDRYRDWEEIEWELRIAAEAELGNICRRAPTGLRNPQGFIWKGLARRLTGARGGGGPFKQIILGSLYGDIDGRDLFRPLAQLLEEKKLEEEGCADGLRVDLSDRSKYPRPARELDDDPWEKDWCGPEE